jgi:predicted transcriptional regulator
MWGVPRPLGDLEDAVMTRVWQWNRPVTVREVLEDLQRERSIAYTTVMTVMDNLHQKGWVRREVEGRAYRYTAVSTRAAYAAALMNEAWSKSDNQAAALVAFFGMMSPEQRRSLADAVRIARGDETPVEEDVANSGAAPSPVGGAHAHNGAHPSASGTDGGPGGSVPGADTGRGPGERTA